MSKQGGYCITRDTYRKVKKFDHGQMSDYIQSIYSSGYEQCEKDMSEKQGVQTVSEQPRNADSFTVDEIIEAVKDVKGIGATKLADIKIALKMKLQERGGGV